MTDGGGHPIAVWSGDLLWPRDLVAAPIIDARAVTGMGVWVHAWLRRHPDCVVLADEALRARLVPLGVRCYADLAELQRGTAGVSASERALLWEDA